MGYSLYAVALLFETLEEITFYYYYLTSLVSLILVFFLGSMEQYSGYEPSGRFAVGCVEEVTKVGQNRVLIYYPTDKEDQRRYLDLKWASDGEHTLKGLMKFALDIVP